MYAGPAVKRAGAQALKDTHQIWCVEGPKESTQFYMGQDEVSLVVAPLRVAATIGSDAMRVVHGVPAASQCGQKQVRGGGHGGSL